MQSSSRGRPFKPGLIGASPITDTNCSQGVISSARRSAKAEARGANPRESASFKAPVPQQPQGEFRKLVFVGASPARASSFNSGSWCNSSISPCEGDGPGANPGFLTNPASSQGTGRIAWATQDLTPSGLFGSVSATQNSQPHFLLWLTSNSPAHIASNTSKR